MHRPNIKHPSSLHCISIYHSCLIWLHLPSFLIWLYLPSCSIWIRHSKSLNLLYPLWFLLEHFQLHALQLLFCQVDEKMYLSLQISYAPNPLKIGRGWKYYTQPFCKQRNETSLFLKPFQHLTTMIIFVFLTFFFFTPLNQILPSKLLVSLSGSQVFH